LIFGEAGMLTAYLSAGLSRQVNPAVLLILFAVLMIAIGGLMFWQRTADQTNRSTAPWLIVVASGAGVGVLTGFLGVGGGFLIVPALVMLIGLPMPVAIGTSLIVIAMNSLAGLLGHLTGAAIDIRLIVIFVTAGLVGTYAGARLAHRLRPDRLRAVFAIFVIALALFLLYDNVPKLLS